MGANTKRKKIFLNNDQNSNENGFLDGNPT
jgi:hypothetical protein